MDEMKIIDIVEKLIGNVNPTGESNEDELRFHNLIMMCNLVDGLLGDIINVADLYKNSQEFSVKRASDYAKKVLKEMGIK